MQIVQLKIPSKISSTSFPPLIFFSGFAPSLSDGGNAVLDISSCRFLAFSLSVNDSSASTALIAATRPPEPLFRPVPIEFPAAWPGSAAGAQSGHPHSRASATVSGRTERQVTCQGLVHVVQERISSGDGVWWHIMQMPSGLQGRTSSSAILSDGELSWISWLCVGPARKSRLAHSSVNSTWWGLGKEGKMSRYDCMNGAFIGRQPGSENDLFWYGFFFWNFGSSLFSSLGEIFGKIYRYSFKCHAPTNLILYQNEIDMKTLGYLPKQGERKT